jgi:hypothetical protein
MASAPQVTPEQIEACIIGEDYHVFPGTTSTVCCLKLKNGYTAIGESACVCLENFNSEFGRKIAREHAKEKIWALEGYLLRQNLHDGV